MHRMTMFYTKITLLEIALYRLHRAKSVLLHSLNEMRSGRDFADAAAFSSCYNRDRTK